MGSCLSCSPEKLLCTWGPREGAQIPEYAPYFPRAHRIPRGACTGESLLPPCSGLRAGQVAPVCSPRPSWPGSPASAPAWETPVWVVVNGLFPKCLVFHLLAQGRGDVLAPLWSVGSGEGREGAQCVILASSCAGVRSVTPRLGMSFLTSGASASSPLSVTSRIPAGSPETPLGAQNRVLWVSQCEQCHGSRAWKSLNVGCPLSPSRHDPDCERPCTGHLVPGKEELLLLKGPR